MSSLLFHFIVQSIRVKLQLIDLILPTKPGTLSVCFISFVGLDWYNEGKVVSLRQSEAVQCITFTSFCSVEANQYNIEEPTTQSRHRRNSSLSTSMSNVPDFMVQAQFLSPRGLTATAKLFEDASGCATAKLYALRGEDVNFGLGISNVNVLGDLEHCDEDIYEFCHTEEGGGIPVNEKKPKEGGKMRGRDEIDVGGDFVAVDHYHLEDDSSSDDEDNGIAQGGASLDVLTPFPAFGTLTPFVQTFLEQ
jgi:hypothetical protein